MQVKYKQTLIEALAYVVPDEIVKTADIESQLAEVYQQLGIPTGQVEFLTQVHERRYWPPQPKLAECAALAAKRALKQSPCDAQDLDVLIYAGVGRDQLEPATACEVAARLGCDRHTQVYDVSNACLGVANGILQCAAMIESNQIETAMVVSAESSREIIESSIRDMKQRCDMQHMMLTLATLTGGSAAVAVILRHAGLKKPGHRLISSVTTNAIQHYDLCRWGPITGGPSQMQDTMSTDSIQVLKQGLALAKHTYPEFLATIADGRPPDKIICHQVGHANQTQLRSLLGFQEQQDFVTYTHFGNCGTASLPMTAAMAEEAGFLTPGDRVGLLTQGSGINCIMMYVEW